MLSKKLLDELMWNYDSLENKSYKFFEEVIKDKINKDIAKGFYSISTRIDNKENIVEIIL